MKSYLRKKCINFLARHLFDTIIEEDLLRRNGRGHLEIRGVELPREKEDLLKEQATALLNSTLWTYIKTDVKHHAIQKTLHQSQTMDDVISGKLMLYLIDVIETRLDNLRRDH